MSPQDGSWLALALWALGIGAVAWFWEQLEERWLEWRWTAKQRKTARALADWYAARPARRSQDEPWLGPDQRKHSKGGAAMMPDAQDSTISIRAIPDRGRDSEHAVVLYAHRLRAAGSCLLSYGSHGDLIGIHYFDGTGMFLELDRGRTEPEEEG